jgi:hypothetical protein
METCLITSLQKTAQMADEMGGLEAGTDSTDEAEEAAHKLYLERTAVGKASAEGVDC